MNRLRPQRSQRPPSSFSPLSGKSLLGRILCSLAACSLFSLFCRVLSANIIGVDRAWSLFSARPVLRLPSPAADLLFYPPQKPFPFFGSPGASAPVALRRVGRRKPKSRSSLAFFSRFLRCMGPVLDIAIFTLLFFILSPDRIFPAAAHVPGLLFSLSSRRPSRPVPAHDLRDRYTFPLFGGESPSVISKVCKKAALLPPRPGISHQTVRKRQ